MPGAAVCATAALQAERLASKSGNLGYWACGVLVRQRLRLPAVGFAQLNCVWPASRIPLPQVTTKQVRRACPCCRPLDPVPEGGKQESLLTAAALAFIVARRHAQQRCYTAETSSSRCMVRIVNSAQQKRGGSRLADARRGTNS
jgi:hypothetical protein